MTLTEKHLVFVADGQLLMIGMAVKWRGRDARIMMIESYTGELDSDVREMVDNLRLMLTSKR